MEDGTTIKILRTSVRKENVVLLLSEKELVPPKNRLWGRLTLDQPVVLQAGTQKWVNRTVIMDEP